MLSLLTGNGIKDGDGHASRTVADKQRHPTDIRKPDIDIQHCPSHANHVHGSAFQLQCDSVLLQGHLWRNEEARQRFSQNRRKHLWILHFWTG